MFTATIRGWVLAGACLLSFTATAAEDPKAKVPSLELQRARVVQGYDMVRTSWKLRVASGGLVGAGALMAASPAMQPWYDATDLDWWERDAYDDRYNATSNALWHLSGAGVISASAGFLTYSWGVLQAGRGYRRINGTGTAWGWTGMVFASIGSGLAAVGGADLLIFSEDAFPGPWLGVGGFFAILSLPMMMAQDIHNIRSRARLEDAEKDYIFGGPKVHAMVAPTVMIGGAGVHVVGIF